MIKKGKQLTFSQRNKIEKMLNQRKRKFEIASEFIELVKHLYTTYFFVKLHLG